MQERLASPPAGDTRQQVLNAVLTLFTERGYFNTSVQDIGRESKVSIGSIYHHFKDKEGIARALYQELTERMTDGISSIIGRHGTTHDRCQAIVAMLFEITEHEPRAMEFMLYAKHREFMPSEKPVCSSKPFEMMRNVVLEGMERGEIRQMDPMVASICLFGGPIRMITARLDGILPAPLPHYLDEVWSCAWRAVAA